MTTTQTETRDSERSNSERSIVKLECLQPAREYLKAEFAEWCTARPSRSINPETWKLRNDGEGEVAYPPELRRFLERFYSSSRLPDWVLLSNGSVVLGWDGGNGITETFDW